MAEPAVAVWLARLTTWLEQFEPVFSHRAQRGGLRRYVEGVRCDSRRKSMAAMWARVRDPGTYQALQYFLTDAAWSADALWRQLRAVLPARAGVLILDGTGLPKQGAASVGVSRQYSGTLGKIGNCQVAVTAALWTGVQAWLVGAQLYLPQAWLTPAQRSRGRIPARLVFQEKWRQALTLLRQVRAAGLTVTAVVADAEFGDCTAFRCALHHLRLPYALGVASTLTVFRGTPRVPGAAAPRAGRRRARPTLPAGVAAVRVRALAEAQPARAWRVVSWRNGPRPAWRARFWRCRVTPAHDWRHRRLGPEVWLLCQRSLRGDDPKYFLVHLPPTASLRAAVRPASALGDRTAIRRVEDRIGAGRLRRALLSRLEPPRRPRRVGRCVSAGRAATARPATPHVSTGARGDDRHPHRLSFRHASAQSEDAVKTGGNPASDLTKSY